MVVDQCQGAVQCSPYRRLAAGQESPAPPRAAQAPPRDLMIRLRGAQGVISRYIASFLAVFSSTGPVCSLQRENRQQRAELAALRGKQEGGSQVRAREYRRGNSLARGEERQGQATCDR